MAIMGLVLRAEGDLDGAWSMLEAALRISRRTGDSRSIACAILNLACLAGDAGDWERAAALHGTAQALQDRVSNPWENSRRAIARTASTRRVLTWATSSWSGPTPGAGRSALRRRSTWPCDDPVRPDRCRRRAPARRALRQLTAARLLAEE